MGCSRKWVIALRTSDSFKRTHLVQAVPKNLYREIPRLEIISLEQLDTYPQQVALGMGNDDLLVGKRRTSSSLGRIGLLYMDFLELLLQPSRVDDGHWMNEVRGRGKRRGLLWGKGIRRCRFRTT